MAGGFVEGFHLHIGDPGADPERLADTAPRNIVTNQRKVQRLRAALTPHGDRDLGALGTFQHAGDLRDGHALGVDVVYPDDLVRRAEAGLICRRSLERVHHDHPAFGRAHVHPDAKIVAGLTLAHQLVSFGIEEIGMRIQGAQHAGDGAFKHGGVRLHLLGEVGLHRLVDLSEFLDACAHIGVGLRRKLKRKRKAEKGRKAEQQAPPRGRH